MQHGRRQAQHRTHAGKERDEGDGGGEVLGVSAVLHQGFV